MHTLFVNERWVRNDPNLREARGTVESYLESEFGTASEFHCDEYYYNHKRDWNFPLIEKIIEEKPDAIFYMWINSQYNPSLDVFSIIHKMKIPIVCWWGDFSFEGSVRNAQNLSPFISTHLIADTPIALTNDVHVEKYKHIWPTPINQFFFKGEEKDRIIPVSFPGGTIEGGNKGPREKYIKYLIENGVGVFVGGTRKEETTMQYADTLRKSQIVINFSPLGQYGCPLKGRSFEAIWCGSLLMEPSGSFLEYHFKPYSDYVPYDNENDLLNKVRYFNANKEERESIANRGYERAIQKYNPFSFWNKIFNDYLIPYDLNLDMQNIRGLLDFFISKKKEVFCNDFVFIKEISYLIENLNIKEFWETGSYLGHSSDFIKSLFTKLDVFSCDIHEGYLEIARNNCSLVDYKLIDSVNFLKERVDNYSVPTFVFLDAHGHGGGLPLEKELQLIGNSGNRYALCIHDCKLPKRPIFGWDSYDGVDISVELIEKVLKKTSCDFDIYIPSSLYYHDPLRGRCYVLVNWNENNIVDSKLFTSLGEL